MWRAFHKIWWGKLDYRSTEVGEQFLGWEDQEAWSGAVSSQILIGEDFKCEAWRDPKHKSAFDPTGLGYDFSSPSITSTSTTVFVPPANNVEIKNNVVKNELANENLDKEKSILGAPPKQDKKDVKNPKAKKANS